MERVKLPPAVADKVVYVGKEARLFDWLLEKKLDAVIYAHLTRPPVPDGAVRCLFPDAVQQEKKYFQKHGVIPIMHLMALKEKHLEKGLGIARKVERVLRKEKESFFKRLEMVSSAGVLPWFSEYVEDTAGVLGRDPWPHGIEANRKGLEKFLDYSMAQGLISRRPELEGVVHRRLTNPPAVAGSGPIREPMDTFPAAMKGPAATSFLFRASTLRLSPSQRTRAQQLKVAFLRENHLIRRELLAHTNDGESDGPRYLLTIGHDKSPVPSFRARRRFCPRCL